MKTVCLPNMCTGCMACICKCKRDAVTIEDSIAAYNAVIDTDKCIECGMCEKVCPNNHPVERLRPIFWREGCATDHIRQQSSSGGAASAMMMSFAKNGGYVATCLFKNGKFVFEITNKADDIRKFAGSKYVKSNPLGIYDTIAAKLKDGERVLFIGLPCQVAAIKNFTASLPETKKRNLCTVDLICHGSPSPQIFEMALKEKGIDLNRLDDVRFRNKTCFGLSQKKNGQSYQFLTPMGVQDMYTYAFLSSIDYTDNCYSCQYATIERVADVTIGDSWGSNSPQEEQRKGMSLILCQTEKGKYLIEHSGMQLKEVDLDKAVEANHQLNHPSVAPKSREVFFANLDKGFYRAISKCSPKVYYKQKLKEFLLKHKIIRGKRD